MKKTIFLFLFIIWGLSISHAEILTFTSKADFQTALSGSGYCYRVIDFESSAPGTEYPPGSIIDEVQFIYGLPEDVIIDNTFTATSGKNYLGVSGDNAFLSEDMLDLLFSQTIYAIALYAIGSPGDIHGDDLELDAGNMTVLNSSNPNKILQDGSEAFFMGIVDTDSQSGFCVASFMSNFYDGEYEFHIDDIFYGIKTNLTADEDRDCDVDGVDLAIFAQRSFTKEDLSTFAAQYGM